MRALLLLSLAAAAHAAAPPLPFRPRRPAAFLDPSQQRQLGGAFSVGGLLGFCAAQALKEAGDAASVAVGAAFLVIAALQRGGYVTIHYAKLERDVRGLFDLNKDGKVDSEDYELVSSRLMRMLTHNSAGTMTGLAAGFALGLKTR
ncbi:hypothetical protein AB1Y20_013257 [Prymnesium parvum]|uniref:EF-hand domain-containing protein n=1 Tax=Prymnesium parvum TaxID=97485 RepID=A0AB34IL36_PRYPA